VESQFCLSLHCAHVSSVCVETAVSQELLTALGTLGHALCSRTSSRWGRGCESLDTRLVHSMARPARSQGISGPRTLLGSHVLSTMRPWCLRGAELGVGLGQQRQLS
jgi:hypothetical protein